jgi:hypothetical protein
VEPASNLQDQREVVCISQASAATARFGGPSTHFGIFPNRWIRVSARPCLRTNSTSADPDKNAGFAILQKYNRVNLLIPIGAPHMWHAAVESKTVKLTALGEHYRRLAAKGLI